MSEVREFVDAEMDNVDRVVAEFPVHDSLANLSSLELAGVAALVHNFYNGIENILKHVVVAFGKGLPDGASWHRELVNVATSSNIISEATAQELRRYLAFRHFFSHAYSFDLDEKRVIPLVKDIQETLAVFKNDIAKAIERV